MGDTGQWNLRNSMIPAAQRLVVEERAWSARVVWWVLGAAVLTALLGGIL